MIKKLLLFTSFLIVLGSFKLSFGQISPIQSGGCAPYEAKFNFSTSETLTNIMWDFGDPGTGSSLEVTHIFINPGVYIITFDADNGDTHIHETATVTVYGKPSTDFLSDITSGCLGDTIHFADISEATEGTNIESWAWTWGNGEGSTEQSPSYLFQEEGIFNISLKVTDNNGCDSSIIKMQYITLSTPPVSVISSDASLSACTPPLTLNFTGENSHADSPYSGGVASYFWEFHDGTTATTAYPPEMTFAENGSFSFSLTTGDINGCKNTVNSSVVIGSPVSEFSVINDGYQLGDTLCSLVRFAASPAGEYHYDFGNGETGDFSNDTILYNYPFTNEPHSTYEVRLVSSSTNGSCPDTSFQTVVIENIQAKMTPGDSASCLKRFTLDYSNISIPSVNIAESYWYQTNLPDTVETPNYSYEYQYIMRDDEFSHNNSLHFIANLKVVSLHGCVSSISSSLELSPPTITFTADKTQGCAPLEVDFHTVTTVCFDLYEPFYHTWDFGDGTTDVDNEEKHVFQTPGEYEVSVSTTHYGECQDTSFVVLIKVGERADLNFSVMPDEVCPGEPVYFTDLTSPADSVDDWHFQTDGNLMSACSGTQNPFWSFSSEAGLHDVVFTGGYNGCYTSVTQEDAVHIKGPVVHIDNMKIDCDDLSTVSFTGDSTETEAVVWDFGDGNFSSEINPIHTYASPGEYTVTLTGSNSLSGCSDFSESKVVIITELEANFMVESEVCARDSVSFSAALSKSVHREYHRGFLWYWGDGSRSLVSSESSALHVFDTAGVFETTLVVRDVNWCTDTATFTINVFDVYPEFEATPEYGCAPFNTDFTNISTFDHGTQLASSYWTFNTDDTSQEENPSYEFTDVLMASYQVSLTVTDSMGCTNTKVSQILNSIPNTNFTPETITKCAGDSTLFLPSDTTHNLYRWNMGDGTIVTSSGSGFYHTYDFEGNFPIQIYVEDSINCIAADTVYNKFLIQDFPSVGFSVLEDNILDSDTLCYPATLTFVDTTSISNSDFDYLSWNLGVIDNVLPLDTVIAYFPERGSFETSLEVGTTYGCVTTVKRNLVLVGPVANINISDTLICKGHSVEISISDSINVKSYTFDFGDGTSETPTVNPVSHYYNTHPSGGVLYPTLIVHSNTHDCSMAIRKPLKIHQVIADFVINDADIISDSAVCLNENIHILHNSTGGADNWAWSYGDNTTNISGQDEDDHFYKSSGVYEIALNILDTETQCVDTITKQVVIHPLPVVNAMVADTCSGDAIEIILESPNDSLQFDWTPKEYVFDENVQNPFVNPPESMYFYVAVTDTNNCKAFDTAYVYIQHRPDASDWDTTIIVGQSIVMNAFIDSTFTYSWESDHETDCKFCPQVNVQPLPNPTSHDVEVLDYFVTIKDTLDCFEEKYMYAVTVLPETSLDMPTVFTPTGDGINDIVYVRGWGIKELVEYKIYNRWGQVVFSTDDINVGWDGTWKGQKQNADTYVYHVTIKTYIETEIFKKGYINLVR